MKYYTLNGDRYQPIVTPHGIALRKAGKVKVAPGQINLFGQQDHREGETRTNAAGHQEVLQGGHWHLQNQPQAQPQQPAQPQFQGQPQQPQGQVKAKAPKMTPEDIAKDLQAFSSDPNDHEWVLELAGENSPKDLKGRIKETQQEIKGIHEYLEEEVSFVIPLVHLAQQLQPQMQNENTYNAVASLAQSTKRFNQASAQNPHDPHVQMAQQIRSIHHSPDFVLELMNESPDQLSKRIDGANQEIAGAHEEIRSLQHDIKLTEKALEYAHSLKSEADLDRAWELVKK